MTQSWRKVRSGLFYSAILKGARADDRPRGATPTEKSSRSVAKARDTYRLESAFEVEKEILVLQPRSGGIEQPGTAMPGKRRWIKPESALSGRHEFRNRLKT